MRNEREIVFVWVPGYVGVRGSLAANSADMDDLDSSISNKLIPVFDLKLDLTNMLSNSHEWDEQITGIAQWLERLTRG